MFVAALVAAALAVDSVEEAQDAAQAEIPAESRYAEMVRRVRGWARQLPDPEACRDRIEEQFGGSHWVHTLNNAAIVVICCNLTLVARLRSLYESPRGIFFGSIRTYAK
jgi:hypothetical protein